MTIFDVTEFIGIVAFAMSGFFVAYRSGLDLLGILISVFLTSFGGGIIRDVIVDKKPYVFGSEGAAWAALVVMLVLLMFPKRLMTKIERSWFFIFSDSVGLVSFAVTGSLVALESSLNLTGVLALAFLTAVGGGILRDVMINEVPLVVKTGFYGTVALIVGLGVYLLDKTDMLGAVGLGLLFLFGVALRVTAYARGWKVPARSDTP